jgi:hypothetical protein
VLLRCRDKYPELQLRLEEMADAVHALRSNWA